MSDLVGSAPVTSLALRVAGATDERATAQLSCTVDAPLRGAMLWAIAEEATLDGAPLPRPADKPFYRWQLPDLNPDSALTIELTRDPATAMTDWWSAQLRAGDDQILATTSVQAATSPNAPSAPQPQTATSTPVSSVSRVATRSGDAASAPRMAARMPSDLLPAKPLEHRPAILAGADGRQITVAAEHSPRQLARAANAVMRRVLAYPSLLPHLILVRPLLPTLISAPPLASRSLVEMTRALDDFLDDVVAATLPEPDAHPPWQIPPRRLIEMNLPAYLADLLDACASGPPSTLAPESRATAIAGAVQLAGLDVLMQGEPAVGDGLHAMLWLIPVRVPGDAELTGALAAYRDALAAQFASLRGCDAVRCMQILMARRSTPADRAADVLAQLAAQREVVA